MRATPKFHQFHMVVNLNDQCRNKGEIWATKYIAANSKGSRLKYWQINSMLEIVGTAKSVQWDNLHSNQKEQLQAALGDTFKVLEQFETLQAVTDYHKG